MKIHTVELPLGEPGRHEVVLLADHGQALAKMLAERNTAQAQLAEAMRLGKALYSEFVNLLYGGYDRITELGGDCDPVPKMEAENPAMQEWKAFLARHAQAEQQEARNAEVARESLRPENQRLEPVEPLRVPHPLEAQEIGPLKGVFAEAAEQAFREQYGLQEAQGAPAVDGLDPVAEAIFNADKDNWYSAGPYLQLHANDKARLIAMARAALATQPAAYVLTKDGEIYWEGDDGIVISNTTGDCLDESYEWRAVGFISQPAVRGAEHE